MSCTVQFFLGANVCLFHLFALGICTSCLPTECASDLFAKIPGTQAYDRVFFLAPNEEDAMIPLVPEYWKAHQQGKQALEAIRLHIWETWLAKFPIDFLALTGCYSTKEDDIDCRHRKLRVHSSYYFTS
ncbi:hypothetical protein F5146DRAFT_1007286 [Armillaria mellea]|nr:hypothetical protein F5146DRAFT_1007286 [Armillaria mellea]